MDFKKYLLSYQTRVSNTFINAKRQNKVAQTYLIKGSDGAPVFECARFLSKSLVCDEDDSFACDTCLSCIRFDEGNYTDIKILDSSKGNIKVSDIEELQTFLSESSLEKKGIKIYIINLVENLSNEVINALLKTLEEPNSNTYAFLTTLNDTKVLPTIISRAQVLNLLPVDKNILLDELNDTSLSPIDKELLSCVYKDKETIIKESSDESYIKVKSAILDTIDTLVKNPKSILYQLEQVYLSKSKKDLFIDSKEEVRLFIDLLSVVFKDIMYLNIGKEISLKSKKEDLEKIKDLFKDVESIYLEIMLVRSKIDLNVYKPLILEHIFIKILEGEK
jgi:DNA polymerase III subunit delta'